MREQIKKTINILVITSYIVAVGCLLLSPGMIYSAATEEGVAAVVIYKNTLVYPVIVLSYMTAIMGVLICCLRFVHSGSRRQKVLSVLLVISSAFSIYSSHYFLRHYSLPYNKKICRMNMRNILGAMSQYIHEYGVTPPADQWCDALQEHMNKRIPDYNSDHWFICPGGGEGRCHVAANPNVNIDSPPGIVWFFDSYAGWNQNGGKELLNSANHEGKGCYVIFWNRGGINFINKEDFDDLKWE